MTHTISGAHIFSAGTWNGQTFTEADLDGIVQAFHEAGKAGRVPLKFGHGDSEDAQPFREGLPALGWVSKIWRQGKQLMADFTDIPKAVYQAIKNANYKFTSIELLKNAEYDGKRFPHLLDAVALLGAEPPAVDGLSDLQRLVAARAIQGERVMFTMKATDAPATTTQVTVALDTDGIAPDDLGKIAKAPKCTLRLGAGSIGDIVKVYVSRGKLLIDVQSIGVDTGDALSAGKFDRIEPKLTRSVADGLVLESAKVIGLDVSQPITHARKPLITVGNSRGVPVNELAELRRKLVAAQSKLAAAEGERDELRSKEKKFTFAQQKAIRRKHFEEMNALLEEYVRGRGGLKILPAARLAFKRDFLPNESAALSVTPAQIRTFAQAANASKLINWHSHPQAQGQPGDVMEVKTPVQSLLERSRAIAARTGKDIFKAMTDAVREDETEFAEIMEHDAAL